MLLVCLTGWYTAADSDVNPPMSKVQIDNLIPADQLPKRPNFEAEVLRPLRQQQAAKAAQEAQEAEARAAKAAADERQRLLEQKEAMERSSVVQVAQASGAPITGDREALMASAGIDPANYGYVDYIVSHESGWNPCAYYPGRSNCSLSAADVNATDGNPNWGGVACGLGMQLPCGKWAGAWNDPVAALRAMNVYVNKYGGWAGAYNYWLAHKNY